VARVKYVTFLDEATVDPFPVVGVLLDDTRVLPLPAAYDASDEHDLEPDDLADLTALLSRGAAGWRAVSELVSALAGRQELLRNLAELRLLAPIPRPPRLRDYMTYRGHIGGSGMDVPAVFTKYPVCYKGNHLAVQGTGSTVPWPSYARRLDYESEIAIIAGRGGENLTVAQAQDAIGAITIFNDFSARDTQFEEMAMRMGPSKGKDFANAFGPCAITLDEIPDEFAINMRTLVNGEIWSKGSTAGRQFSFAEILAWASRDEPVYPGEVLGIGTHDGGCGYELRRWIQPGDVVQIQADGIGTLENRVGARREEQHAN
jgi:2-keto-4-pentenoate hydratase/2-oxohepta-3-ene-1,7-dioic acid hydratase in catechol pathway